MSTRVKAIYGDSIKELRQNMGKDTEDPVVELLSKNEMSQIPVNNIDAQLVVKDNTDQIDRLRYIYGYIRKNGPISTQDIIAGTKFTPLVDLVNDGLVSYEEMKLRGNPKSYSVTDKPFPAEWGTIDAIMSMDAPVIVPVKKTSTKSIGTRTVKDPSKNALTRMMEKDITIPQDTEDSYRKFLMDMQMLHYGVQELDDLIKDILRVVDRRLDNIAYECPLCKGKLQRNISEARCTNPRCGIKIDAGDFQKSLKVIALMKSHSGEL